MLSMYGAIQEWLIAFKAQNSIRYRSARLELTVGTVVLNLQW